MLLLPAANMCMRSLNVPGSRALYSTRQIVRSSLALKSTEEIVRACGETCVDERFLLNNCRACRDCVHDPYYETECP
jgi:hypothetical protein